MFVEVLLFTLSVTAPIFLWLLLGGVLKVLGLLNEQWISRGSWFVFYVSLPVLMFTSMVRKPIAEVFEPTLLIVCLICTFSILALSRWWSTASRLTPEDATVMQQGALRGNLGIIGILLCLHAYGDGVLTQVSLLMAMMTIVYNVVSVYIFVDGLNEGRLNLKLLFVSLMKNPLIVAILASLPVAFASVRIPPEVFQWTDGFVTVTLPIALICIGGTLSYRSVKNDVKLLLKTASLKLVLMPVIGILLVLLMGVQGQPLGVVFLLMASPTAAASFVMTKAYGGNAALAANIVVFTTLGSLLTISLGVFVLTYLQLM
ncbi:AEC family transporter [Aestuariicella hydrocarbonica]|uniref:AEC family transporter n=1 Tax=Pseudomaricurvus hydrocarbonicus TaxID=1470433 RepID=A0A9E5JU25_9GAMM|nr:AEC family transporter [Aestuariicella hydrocarbonica]NHO65314.1 AEC family transporter [Aestuariicella hydrocarbonica]